MVCTFYCGKNSLIKIRRDVGCLVFKGSLPIENRVKISVAVIKTEAAGRSRV